MNDRITTRRALVPASLALLLLLAGCGSGEPETPVAAAAVALPDSLFLAAAPAEVPTLIEAKATARVGDEVRFVARVGGRRDPFVADRAVMIVVDPSLPSCDEIEGDNCPMPWDYCCETPADLLKASATVQVSDAAGAPLACGLRGAGGIEPLRHVTIVGRVLEADDSGLFVVEAVGIALGG